MISSPRISSSLARRRPPCLRLLILACLFSLKKVCVELSSVFGSDFQFLCYDFVEIVELGFFYCDCLVMDLIYYYATDLGITVNFLAQSVLIIKLSFLQLCL